MMGRRFTIRTMGALTLALAAGLAMPSVAQEVTFTVLSHKVHENVSRGLVPGTTGGDIAGEWAKRKNVKINWVTANIEPMHDRLFRELSLRETSVDVAFVINKFTTPKVARLLEPLDAWQARSPIEALDGIPASLLAGVRYNNALMAVPFRHATTGLHWNAELFKERGLANPPRNADEVIEYAGPPHIRFGSKADQKAGRCDVRSFLDTGHLRRPTPGRSGADTGHHSSDIDFLKLARPQTDRGDASRLQLKYRKPPMARSAAKARPIATRPRRRSRRKSSGISVRWALKPAKDSRIVCHSGKARKLCR